MACGSKKGDGKGGMGREFVKGAVAGAVGSGANASKLVKSLPGAAKDFVTKAIPAGYNAAGKFGAQVITGNKQGLTRTLVERKKAKVAGKVMAKAKSLADFPKGDLPSSRYRQLKEVIGSKPGLSVRSKPVSGAKNYNPQK